MPRPFFALSFGVGALLLATHHAFAQPSRVCAPRATVVEQLEGSWGEVRRSAGLGASNRLIELFVAEETGTWTIIATLPTGLTCILAAGTDFELLPLPAAGHAL